jgi:hypothetical protein
MRAIVVTDRQDPVPDKARHIRMSPIHFTYLNGPRKRPDQLMTFEATFERSLSVLLATALTAKYQVAGDRFSTT